MFFCTIGAILFASCSQQRYAVSSVNGQHVAIKLSPNTPVNQQELQLVAHYKGTLDSQMNEVLGLSSEYMTYTRPESLLTNLTSDVMLQYGNKHTNGNCDLASMNVHGHRANLAKGNITLGNLFETYSFENTLVLIKLKGSDLLDAFEGYAKQGGAGISSTAQLEIKDGKLLKATLKGQAIDPQKTYTIITLDYLADGNDGMNAFAKSTERLELGITLRDAMIGYVKEQTAQGKEITSALDGRITIK